jgi:3-hydroxy acid dehydrogenase/malonic semialdehyde reductase
VIADHVVNLGSTAATYPYPGGNATKAFVRQFSLNLMADLLGTKVRVTDVEPGLVGGAEFSAVRFRGDAERTDKLYESATRLPRTTSPRPCSGSLPCRRAST